MRGGVAFLGRGASTRSQRVRGQLLAILEFGTQIDFSACPRRVGSPDGQVNAIGKGANRTIGERRVHEPRMVASSGDRRVGCVPAEPLRPSCHEL